MGVKMPTKGFSALEVLRNPICIKADPFCKDLSLSKNFLLVLSLSKNFRSNLDNKKHR